VDDVANGHPAGLQLRDPLLAARVSLTLEHVTVQLVDDVARIGRTRLLSRGNGRRKNDYEQEHDCSEHGDPSCHTTFHFRICADSC
jgi:hypothetical protein